MANVDEDFSFKQLFLPLTTNKVIVLILIVGVIVFFNALFNGFVWDDTGYILSNPEVHSFSLSKIFGSSFFNKDGYYRAIPAFYFTVVYGLFAKQSFFYHFFQISLHIVNTMLLFRLFRNFFKQEASLFLALIFLVHPINVESVAFIGATISPLFVFFGLCALQLLLSHKPFTTRRYVSITFLLFLSILTKEGGVLFFLIALLFMYLFKKGRVVKLFLYECLVVPVYLFLRIVVGKVYLTGIESHFFGQGSMASDGRFVPIMTLSFIERLMMIPSIMTYYLKTVFFPVRLAVDQTWIITSPTFVTFYLPLFFSLLFFSLLLLFGWHLQKTKNASWNIYLFFFIWFVLGIGMHLQLLALDMTVADRWFYFPLIGLLGMLYVLSEYYFAHNKKSTILTISLFLVLLLSVRTMIRNANYANEITLYEHDRLVENNYEIELNLGSAYSQMGDLDQIHYHYTKSVELYPNEANLDSMGLFSEWKGNLDEAKVYYEKALAARSFYLNPNKRLPLTYSRLGYIYLKEENYEKAKQITIKGLRQYPKEQALWLQLAQSEYKLNHLTEALAAINKAIAIKADDNVVNTLRIIENKKPLEIK